MSRSTWTVVLIKDFDAAKQRLGSALDARARRELAVANAQRALSSAATSHVLVVAGGDEAASLARDFGAEVLVEERPEGQNAAARRGIGRALESGASAVLLLSSDLPLVTREAIDDLLAVAARSEGPLVMAAPATGRGGTNALYLRPPGVISLHFGPDSLGLFRADATSRRVPFVLYESEALALDLDEPSDLERLKNVV